MAATLLNFTNPLDSESEPGMARALGTFMRVWEKFWLPEGAGCRADSLVLALPAPHFHPPLFPIRPGGEAVLELDDKARLINQ